MKSAGLLAAIEGNQNEGKGGERADMARLRVAWRPRTANRRPNRIPLGGRTPCRVCAFPLTGPGRIGLVKKKNVDSRWRTVKASMDNGPWMLGLHRQEC